MGYCKLQIGCMLIILYIVFLYWKECRRFHQRKKQSIFDGLLGLGFLCVLFDGLTAYTVNHLKSVNEIVNRILHLCFLISLDLFIFLLFIYMISITIGLPKKTGKIILVYSPFVINVIIVVMNIQNLEYFEGEVSNYSMGMSAYTCFIMAGIYIFLSLTIFFSCWRDIEKNKRLNIFTYLFVLACITGYQMFHPQALLSSICVTIIVLGVYANQENPLVSELLTIITK